MALDVGTLVGYLKLDTTDVGKGVRQAQSDIRTGLTGMDKDADQAGKRVSGAFGGALTRGLKTAAAGLAAVFAVDRAVQWFKGSIDLASDYNETINKAGTIFGDQMGTMRAWAANSVRTLGMSQRAALDSASGFGDMFAQLGFADDKAAAMSRTVVQMAADFGSFNNLGTEDVLERIAGGLRGEYDSLQKLIPNISAARVETEALAMTGKKSAATLTAQEKAAATLAIVQKDGARAMGDFSRTSNDNANAQKQAAAAAEELATKVGQHLLPAWTAVVRFGRDSVIPFLSGTVDVIVPLISGVVGLVGAFRDLPGPLQGAVIGMIAFLALKDRFATFGGAVKSGLGTAQGTIQSFGEAMRFAGQASEKAGGGISGFAAGARTFTGSAGLMKGAASGLLGVLGGPWGAAFTGATALVGLWLAKQSEAKARVQALSSSLDQQTGAITENSRAVMAKRLLEDGVIDDARKMGLSINDVTSAALGQADALARVNEQIDAYLATNGFDAAAQYADDMRKALGGAAVETGQAVEQAQLLAQATGQAGDASTKAATSFDTAGGAAKDAATDFETMADRLERLRNQALDARSASRDYEQAVDDLADSIKENGRTLDINTEKGRNNQAALDELAAKSVDVARANLEQGTSQDKVNAGMDVARDKFIQQAEKLGMSKAAAKALADQLGLTRTTVSNLADEIGTANTKTVKITVDRGYLNAQIADIQAQLANIKGHATITARLDSSRLKNELKLASNGVNQMNGSIMQFAGGGFRGAGIYSDGADIVRFAEKGTGGEAYIPLAASKRSRSTAILAETNRLMGDPLGTRGTTIDVGGVTVNSAYQDPSAIAQEVAHRLAWTLGG